MLSLFVSLLLKQFIEDKIYNNNAFIKIDTPLVQTNVCKICLYNYHI